MIAWVPHSASAITRTCGKAARSPRWVLGRPNATALAGVSAMSRVVPSRLASRQSRYHAPEVAGVASGRTAARNSARNGSAPSRALARAIAPVVGTCQDPRQRRAQASPSVSSRATSS
jgi:hypothetical protein